jgi:hypothetical protein
VLVCPKASCEKVSAVAARESIVNFILKRRINTRKASDYVSRLIENGMRKFETWEGMCTYICARRRVLLDYEAIFHSCRVAEAPLRCPTNAVGSEYAIAGFRLKSVTTTGLDAVNRDGKCLISWTQF